MFDNENETLITLLERYQHTQQTVTMNTKSPRDAKRLQRKIYRIYKNKPHLATPLRSSGNKLYIGVRHDG